MADPVSASLAALTQPATLLIEKVSNAIGRHFDPTQAIRMAEAEATANRIRVVAQVEADIEIAELRQRAAERFIAEEMKSQSNMESIAAKAIPHLADDAEPEKIDDDWVTNFFDKSRIVSDDQKQELWAKVLAGEGSEAGSFSRKSVNLLADLDKRGADLFTSLCRFIWIIRLTPEPLVFDEQSSIYNSLGIDYNSLGQLETLGLIHFSEATSVSMVNLPQTVSASYAGKQLVLGFPNHTGNKLSVGKVLLTKSGRELFRMANAKEGEGFFDYVYDRWEKESIVPPRNSELEESFNALARQWLADTAIHSNPAIIARHPAYSKIVEMKEAAIPLILNEISQKRNRPHWFQALNDITGMTPAPEEIWGKVEQVAAAWLEWGQEQGYRP